MRDTDVAFRSRINKSTKWESLHHHNHSHLLLSPLSLPHKHLILQIPAIWILSPYDIMSLPCRKQRQLTRWNRTHLRKMTVTQLAKNLPISIRSENPLLVSENPVTESHLERDESSVHSVCLNSFTVNVFHPSLK